MALVWREKVNRNRIEKILGRGLEIQIIILSCEDEYPTEVLELRPGQISWSRTEFSISEGRAGHGLIKVPCNFIFASKPKFYKLLELP